MKWTKAGYTRFFALAALAFFLASAFSACGGSKKPRSQKTKMKTNFMSW